MYAWQDEDEACDITVLVDSDWAGNTETRKSTSGGVLKVGKHKNTFYARSCVQEFRCSGVQVFRCLGVQVFRCSGVQVFRCSGVQGFRVQGSGFGFKGAHGARETLGARSFKYMMMSHPSMFPSTL